MKLWFRDRQDKANPHNASLIHGSEQLEKILDDHRRRVPFTVTLLCENGCYLDVGVGGPLSYVQYRHPDGLPPYFVALAPAEQRGQQDGEFMFGGSLSVIPPQFVLPFELAKELALYFQRTGGRSPEVEWENISES